MLIAAGIAGQRHHAAFHRFFASARWLLDALGLAVFRVIEPLLDKGTIFLALDDTLARKQHLGFEEPPGWSRRAAQRTAPVVLLLYSVIVSWFAQEGHRHYQPLKTSWYAKPRASFGDMLAALRRESLREQSFR